MLQKQSPDDEIEDYYKKWLEAFKLLDICKDDPEERQYRILRWYLLGKIDEDGWVFSVSSKLLLSLVNAIAFTVCIAC